MYHREITIQSPKKTTLCSQSVRPRAAEANTLYYTILFISESYVMTPFIALVPQLNILGQSKNS